MITLADATKAAESMTTSFENFGKAAATCSTAFYPIGECVEITTIFDEEPHYIPGPSHNPARSKCPACGQWGEREQECGYCGHPVD